MPYFNNDTENVKLSVMYMLLRMQTSLTESQLITAVTEAAQANYFDVQLAVTELETLGYLATSSGAKGMRFSLTPKGFSNLALMARNMPESQRRAFDIYVSENKERLLDMEFFSAFVSKNPQGGFNAHLTSLENGRVILSLMINVPDNITAERMCRAWREKNADIYTLLYAVLDDRDN